MCSWIFAAVLLNMQGSVVVFVVAVFTAAAVAVAVAAVAPIVPPHLK